MWMCRNIAAMATVDSGGFVWAERGGHWSGRCCVNMPADGPEWGFTAIVTYALLLVGKFAAFANGVLDRHAGGRHRALLSWQSFSIWPRLPWGRCSGGGAIIRAASRRGTYAAISFISVGTRCDG